MKRSLSLVLLVLLPRILSATQNWTEKSFLEWTEKEARAVLRYSAWVKTQRVRELSPLPAIPRPDEPSEGSGTSEVILPDLKSAENQQGVTYSIQLLSALPLRQALARLSILNGRASQEQALAFVEQASFRNQIVITVGSESSGIDFREFFSLSKAALVDTCYLDLKKSGRKIFLEQYLNPAESGTGQPLFIFARPPEGRDPIRLEEGALIFIAPISRDLRLEQTFVLKKMLYQGRLEL